MAGRPNLSLFKISTGTGVATGGSSTATTIPNAADGNVAENVLVNVSVAAYVLPGLSGGAVTAATGMIVNPGNPIALNVTGYAAIAHLQVASAGRITITPIENI